MSVKSRIAHTTAGITIVTYALESPLLNDHSQKFWLRNVALCITFNMR